MKVDVGNLQGPEFAVMRYSGSDTVDGILQFVNGKRSSIYAFVYNTVIIFRQCL